MESSKLMETNSGVLTAVTVLELLAKTMPDDLAEWCRLRTYSNCREQGFTVYTDTGVATDGKFDPERFYRHVTFSENRNSDEIVVYCGGNMEPYFGGGERPARLTEAEYKAARYFAPTGEGMERAVAEMIAYLEAAL